MRLRSLPPARSPLALRALGSGLRAMLDSGNEARVALAASLMERYAARDVLLTDSGTTALRLAIAGSLVGRSGFVALPAYACYDVATAAIGAGATVRLYDLDPETLEPDGRSLGRLIDEGAAAVVVAHLFGQPVSVDRIEALCRAAGCTLIEDAAQEAGGCLAGRRLGSFGSVSILSFGRGKGITGGSGGAVLIHDERGAAALAATGSVPAGPRGMADMAVAGAMWALARPSMYWLPRALPGLKLGHTVYKEPTEPYGISRAGAAIAEAGLGLLERAVDARRRHAAALLSVLPAEGSVRVAGTSRDDAHPGWLRLPVLIEARARVAAEGPRAASLGIVRSYPRPLDELPPLRPALVSVDAYPGAQRLSVELYTIPTHEGLMARDLRALEEWLRARG